MSDAVALKSWKVRIVLYSIEADDETISPGPPFPTPYG